MGAMVMVPDRTVQQRMRALSKANVIRIGQAAIKQDVAAGDLLASDVLARPPVCAQTMQVYGLLKSVPRMGEVKAGVVLAECRTPPSKRIGSLTVRQRQALADALRRHASGEPIPTGPHRKRPQRSHHCVACGVYIRVVTPERLCGFCIEERAR